MPYKKRYKRRRKFKRRRKRKSSLNTVIVRGPNIVPDRILTKLSYSSAQNFTGTGYHNFVFRGNSLFDPDFTSSGLQPTGFDQLAAFYDRYKVYSCSCSLTMVNNSSEVAQFVLVPIVETSTPSSSISIDQALPYAKQRVLSGNLGTPIVNIYSSMMTKTIRGENIQDDDYSALVSSNPSKQWHYHLSAQAVPSSANAINITWVINMTFKCMFFKRKSLNTS